MYIYSLGNDCTESRSSPTEESKIKFEIIGVDFSAYSCILYKNLFASQLQ